MCSVRVIVIGGDFSVNEILKICDIIGKIHMRIDSRVHYCRTAAASGVGNGVELVDVIDTVGFIFYMHINEGTRKAGHV